MRADISHADDKEDEEMSEVEGAAGKGELGPSPGSHSARRRAWQVDARTRF